MISKTDHALHSVFYCYKKEIGIHIFILSSMGKNQKRLSRKKIIDFEFYYVLLHKEEPSFSHLEYRPIRKQYLEI